MFCWLIREMFVIIQAMFVAIRAMFVIIRAMIFSPKTQYNSPETKCNSSETQCNSPETECFSGISLEPIKCKAIIRTNKEQKMKFSNVLICVHLWIKDFTLIFTDNLCLLFELELIQNELTALAFKIIDKTEYLMNL